MQIMTKDGTALVAGIIPRAAEYNTVGDKQSSLATFSIKVGERPPAVQGERGEAVWANCECWHAAARAAAALKKYDVVMAFGKVKTDRYTNSSGEEKVRKVLVCEGFFVMPPAVLPQAQAQPAALPPEIAEAAEMFTDDGVPF